MARREEWQEQKRLACLLEEWLDPACTFWTATDPVAPSAVSGAIRRQRGVQPGVPDVLVWYRGRSVALELKSSRGKCSPAQRAVRERLLAAGGAWWMARTANAALLALRLSHVPFRRRWKRPRLASWEGPFADPTQRLPQHPQVKAERRAAYRRWLERRRARAMQPQPAVTRDGGIPGLQESA